MKISVEMPIVTECRATQCAYNRNEACHARAITVGDAAKPGCDTFFDSPGHVTHDGTAGVGACKVSDCTYNRDLECGADGILVGFAAGGVNCLTYRAQ